MTDTATLPKQKILVVDTCALLDIIRAPIRDLISSEHVNSAMQFGAALKTATPPIRIVVCNWVVGEYQRSLDGVVRDVRQDLTSMWKKHCQAINVMAVHRNEKSPEIDTEEWIDELAGHGQRIADIIINSSSQLQATKEDEQLASTRTRLARSPSHKGKGSLADAVVTELALRIARMEGCGPDGKPLTALLSSNTKDFCDGRKLKSDLQAEFDTANLHFEPNWAAARFYCLPHSNIQGTVRHK